MGAMSAATTTTTTTADDAAGFEAIFRAHFGDVWRFARRRCPSAEDADDIAAETFTVAWRRRAEMPGETVRLWLFGVARLVLANHRRSSGRQGRLRDRLVHQARPEAVEDRGVDGAGSVLPALAALSAEDRELLIMRGWDELSVTNMAEILGCTANAVSSRLFKARGRLAREIDRQDAGRPGHVVADPPARKEARRDRAR